MTSITPEAVEALKADLHNVGLSLQELTKQGEDRIWRPCDAALPVIERALSALSTLQAVRSENERLREALTFYAENWVWYPGDGEQPNAVDVGSPPTYYEAEPSRALKDDEGQIARQALSTTQDEGKQEVGLPELPSGAGPSDLAGHDQQHSGGGRDV